MRLSTSPETWLHRSDGLSHSTSANYRSTRSVPVNRNQFANNNGALPQHLRQTSTPTAFRLLPREGHGGAIQHRLSQPLAPIDASPHRPLLAINGQHVGSSFQWPYIGGLLIRSKRRSGGGIRDRCATTEAVKLRRVNHRRPIVLDKDY